MGPFWFRGVAALGVAATLAAADFFPLDRLRPGMKGVGRTVFAGDKIEEFEVEILGVLENIGPRQSIVLGRLAGGPLAKTGVMAGMSGSPVYIEGKLAGAVALAFPFATEPIAGIRPIAEMVEAFEQRHEPPPPAQRASLAGQRWMAPAGESLLPPILAAVSSSKLAPIATPVHFAGFTARTLEVFGSSLRQLGLQPMQGAGGASAAASPAMGDPSALQPGSPISVALVRGDLNVNADGTVTHIDGPRVYAFGHRFLSSGPAEMPFMRASVVALLPNLATSFKISIAHELMGTIRQDRATGIYGELGMRPRLIPIDIQVYSSRSGNHRYRLEVINDRFLTPFLLQLAVFSALDATERGLGPSTFQVRGAIRLGGALPAVELDNVYTGEASTAILAALGAAQPLAALMQSGFSDVKVEGIGLELASVDSRRQLRLERAWASRRHIHPGDTIELAAALRGEGGQEIIRRLSYQAPFGTPAGALQVTFADGASANLADLRGLAGREPASGAQLVRAINLSRRNSRLYVRVWRPDRGFQLQSEQLPSPPASLRGVLAAGPSTTGAITNTWSALLAEMEIDAAPLAVLGSETIRVTVKE